METLKHPLNLLWLCILLHLIADFNLQGILADMKQKGWWKKQVKKVFGKGPLDTVYPPGTDIRDHIELPTWYDNDWIAGLICHVFMWSILTFLPLMLVVPPKFFSYIVIINAIVHAVVDHLKCNRLGTLNLCQDQLWHIVQVVYTVSLVYLLTQANII